MTTPRPAAKPRALALIGDRYHNPDYIRVSLDKVFHELDIAVDYTMDYAGLSAASLVKPKNPPSGAVSGSAAPRKPAPASRAETRPLRAAVPAARYSSMPPLA